MIQKSLRSALITALVVVALTLIWAPGAWAAGKYKVLYSFQGGIDGASPYGGLTLDTAGNLYGATYSGGIYNNDLWLRRGAGCGTVFGGEGR